MRIVNLAHGDFVMLGAFLAFWLFNLLAVNPIPGLAIAAALFLLAGLPLYYLLVPRLLRARDPEMLSFILFFGFSQVIEALAAIAFGTSERSIPGGTMAQAAAAIASFLGLAYTPGPVEILGQSFPIAWVASGIASALAVLLVYLYLYRSRIGALTRAVMASREEAISSGINVHRVSAIAFGVGLALAAVAGVFAPFMLGSHHARDGGRRHHHLLRGDRHRLARQSPGHGAGRADLRRLLHVHAELLQLLGQSPALSPAHRRAAAAAGGTARSAGAACLGCFATRC